MPSISFNLFRHPTCAVLDPDAAIKRVPDFFPNDQIMEGDQLALRAERAEQLLDPSKPATRAVVKRMWRDAAATGPAYAFTVALPCGEELFGVVKRHMGIVRTETDISDDVRGRIRAFLTAILPPGVTADSIKEI